MKGAWFGLTLALGLAAACKSDGACDGDDDCPSANACVGRLCVARLGQPYPAAVEVEPDPDSLYTRRDYPSVGFMPEPIKLETDRRFAMRTTLVTLTASPTQKASSVRVVVSVPSELPGRPPVSFEADGSNQDPGQPYQADIRLPEQWMGRAAQINVFPTAPLDRAFGPWQFDFVIAAQPSVPPLQDSELVAIPGVVPTTATPDGPSAITYEARLWGSNRRISNIAGTDAGGKFVLKVQRRLLETALHPRVEVALADAAASPTVLVVPYTDTVAANMNLGMVKFPLLPQPVPFVIPVLVSQPAGENKLPVPGALVRFKLLEEMAPELTYTRFGQTGKDGNTTLALLPGTGGTRDYQVSVVPPADSEAAALCVPKYAIGAAVAGGTGPRVGAALFLPRKLPLAGRVVRMNEDAATQMTVRATRLPAALVSECEPVLGSPPTETVTDGDGRYALLLDPGEYQLEFEPRGGRGIPRHVVPSVTLAAAPRPAGRGSSRRGDGRGGGHVARWPASRTGPGADLSPSIAQGCSWASPAPTTAGAFAPSCPNPSRGIPPPHDAIEFGRPRGSRVPLIGG